MTMEFKMEGIAPIVSPISGALLKDMLLTTTQARVKAYWKLRTLLRVIWMTRILHAVLLNEFLLEVRRKIRMSLLRS